MDYLHELNTDFKLWKNKFKKEKLVELKEIVKKTFYRKKQNFIDIQKEFLEKDKRKYSELIINAKKDFSKIRRQYAYLNQALKLINKDFFDPYYT